MTRVDLFRMTLVLAALIALSVAFHGAYALAVSPVPQQSSSYTLSVSTNSSFYAGSQGILISGQVSPAPPSGTSVGISVLNPNGTEVRVASAPVSSTGSFSYAFTAGGTNWISGEYKVLASWAPSISGPTYNASTTFQYAVMGFSMSISPSSLSIVQGSSGSATVSLSLVTGTPEPVTLTVTGLPSGTAATFSNTPCTPSCTSTLTIYVGSTAPAGTYQLYVTGSGGGMTVTSALKLTVIPTYTVTFTESGIPSGTSWSVTFNGATKSSTTGTITYTGIPAGNYSWSVSTPIAVGTGVRYVASTSSGSISVPSTTSIAVSYSEQFYVSVQSTSGGTVSTSGGWYGANSTVSITATASAGYRFYRWSSSTSPISIANASSPSTTVKVNGPGTVTAQFIK
ncbi:MAG: InlB B-repeat-containing protein, partial [Conexivisphaera sp.]